LITEALEHELGSLPEGEGERLSGLIVDLITDIDSREKIFAFHQHTRGMDSDKKNQLFIHIGDLLLDADSQEKLLQIHSITKSLNSGTKNRLFSHFTALVTDPILNDVFWELRGVRTDSYDSSLTREEVLDRIRRYIRSSLKNYRKNSKGEFKPEVTKRMMVEVNFTGVGGEHNDTHFGIVWDSDPIRDNVLVIPTTSLKEDKKFYNHYFSIGKVDFFTKETVVMLDQTLAISHKRITKETFTDPSSRAITPVYISQDQEWRIRDGIRVSYLGQPTLFDYLLKNFRGFIPEMSNEPLQHSHLLRPFILVSNDPEKLQYSLIDDPGTVYTIFWKSSSVSRGQRDRLLSTWHYALGEHYKDPVTNKRMGVKILRRTSIAAAYSNLIGAASP